MTDNLKPCPFCGSVNVRIGHRFISCQECQALMDTSCDIETGITAWNNRSEPLGNPEELPDKTLLKHCLHEKDCANYGLYDSCIREFNTPICCCHFKTIPDELPEWSAKKIRAEIDTVCDSNGNFYDLGRVHGLKWVLSLRRDK